MRTRTSAQPARARYKETRVLIKEAQSRGWTILGGGRRHFKLRCPNPCRCAHVVSSSTSDVRALANARAFLKSKTCWNGDPQ